MGGFMIGSFLVEDKDHLMTKVMYIQSDYVLD